MGLFFCESSNFSKISKSKAPRGVLKSFLEIVILKDCLGGIFSELI